MFSDAHCHLDNCSDEDLPQAIQRCRDAELDVIVIASMHLESANRAVQIAQANDIVYCAVGIHPWEAHPMDMFEEELFRRLAFQRKVVAISEIGLDRVRGMLPWDMQKAVFRQQVNLARTCGLPVIIHCREAYDEMRPLLWELGGGSLRGAIHGFNGDAAMLQQWLNLDFYISIGRVLLRPEGEGIHEVVKLIPEDRLLTETDSSSGRVAGSGPEAVRQVADKLAELRGTTPEEIGTAATRNLRTLLRLKT